VPERSGEIEYLERDVAELEETQRQARAEMDQLREALRKNQEGFKFGDQTYTRRQVEEDHARRLAPYEDGQPLLEKKQRILQSRRKTLSAATEKINAFEFQQDLLVEKAESLQTELKLLELAQATGDFHFDSSKLNTTKDPAIELEKQIRTLNKLIEDQRPLADGMSIETDARSAAERFDAYFAEAQDARK
jgi:hypothetical protein